jgi:hypothetical protein
MEGQRAASLFRYFAGRGGFLGEIMPSGYCMESEGIDKVKR